MCHFAEKKITNCQSAVDKCDLGWYTLAQYHAITVKTIAATAKKPKGGYDTAVEGIVRNMDKLHCEAVDRLFEAVLSLETIDECYAFFEDACTVKEILDISQRLAVAELLMKGNNYSSISSLTGASTATISRVNKSVAYGNEGYRLVLERTEKRDNNG